VTKSNQLPAWVGDPMDPITSCMEHIQAIRTSMGLQRTEDFTPKPGTPAYHVDAAEDYCQRAWQWLAAMKGDHDG
jgi:hypothetical protein